MINKLYAKYNLSLSCIIPQLWLTMNKDNCLKPADCAITKYKVNVSKICCK